MKQTSNINAAQKALWERIRSFQLDEPGVSFPFSGKLAHENRWTHTFCREAIEEYRKFIFLCCISPHGASPSKVIDEVWHLHLLYTQNYWEEFCGKVLERKLHHHPSRGGPAEDKKHREWQADTLDLYRDTFNTEPPAPFWDTPGERNIRKYRLLLRPLVCGLLLIPLLLLSGCNGATTFSFFSVGFFLIFFLFRMGNSSLVNDPHQKKQSGDKNGSSDGGGGSSCGGGGSSCGSGGGCGGGCGGCGGGGCGS